MMKHNTDGFSEDPKFKDLDGDAIGPHDDTPDDWNEPDSGEFSQEGQGYGAHAKVVHNDMTAYQDDGDTDVQSCEVDDAQESDTHTEDGNEVIIRGRHTDAAVAAKKNAHSQDAFQQDAFHKERDVDTATIAARDVLEPETAAGIREGEGAHAAGYSYTGDTDEVYPDAFQALEPVDRGAILFESDVDAASEQMVEGDHGNEVEELPPHLRHSRRVRKILIIVIIILLVLAAALVYFTYRLTTESQNIAVQQAQQKTSANESEHIVNGSASDAAPTTSRTTEVPNLADLIGMTQDEAIAALGRGATATATRQLLDNTGIQTNVTVTLTDEPADTRTGAPTVYLGLDADGYIVQAGYTASTASLGYGALSFVDAVDNERVIEKTLNEGGIAVEEGVAVLPDDKTEYSTYGSDGTTLVRERCSFSGPVVVANTDCTWSAVLSYDYTTANLTGDLADTVRVIYIYVTVDAAAAEVDTEGDDAAAQAASAEEE